MVIRCYGGPLSVSIVIKNVIFIGTSNKNTSVPQRTKKVIAGIMFSYGHIHNTTAAKQSTGNYRFECTFPSAV